MSETDNALPPRRLRRRTEINIGNMCTSCGRDTGPGSDLFVDRISSGAEWTIHEDSWIEFIVPVDGWLCVDCQSVPCELCAKPVLNWVVACDNGVFMWVHQECADEHGLEIQE